MGKSKSQWALLGFGILVFVITEAIAIFSIPFAKINFESAETTPKEAVATLFAFLLVIFAFLALLKYFRDRNLFGFFFFLSLFFGLNFLFSLYLPILAAFILSLALVLGKALGRKVITQNLALIPGMAGVGLAIGLSFTPNGALILLLALSFYDIVAVYFSKHMIKLFRGMLSHGVIPAVIIPEKIFGLLKNVFDVKPGMGFLLLGTGDLVLPVIFIVAVSGLGMSAIAASVLGSLIGFAATEFIFTHQRLRRPMPALPPIATGTVICFLLERLLFA